MDAFIYECLRTPRGAGRPGGSLAGVPAPQLLAGVLGALSSRTALDTARIGEAIFGCVTQVGEQAGNVGKVAAIEAGWSDAVSVATVNHYCASSLWAFNAAVTRVACGEELIVAGGVESMSRVPMASDQPPFLCDPEVAQRVGAPPMGVSADAVATLYGILREEAEAYAIESQQRAARARTEGRFGRSLVPVHDADGGVLLAEDETIRPNATLDKLMSMTPYFAEIGTAWADALVLERYPALGSVTHMHHAGNSPAMADGASVVLLGSESGGSSLALAPRARILAIAMHADEHVIALNGAMGATRKVLERSGLRVEDVDLFEVNEAFAAPTLVFARAFGIPPHKFNVNGGAIALGHAMGATGTTLIGMLLDELERRGQRRGIAAISGALGVGAAVAIETLQG